MAYIEAELAKKRGGQDATASSDSSAAKPFDPRDELKGKLEKEEEEGNVTLSTGMLMGIPEVDLGIESENLLAFTSMTLRLLTRIFWSGAHSTKLKNIEQTEKAKRLLYESQLAEAKKAEQEREEFAVERCTNSLSLSTAHLLPRNLFLYSLRRSRKQYFSTV